MFGSVRRLSLRREPGRPWVVLIWCWQTQLVMWSSLVYTGGLGRGLAADASDDLVTGATFGPGYSLLCGQGPPVPAAAAAGGPSSAASSRPADGNSHLPHDRTSNLTSFTFCAFLRIRKSRTHSSLLTYTQKTWSATVGLSRLGVALQVPGASEDQVFQYFFEAKFPPGVWRHLCLQFRPELQQAQCLVDGEEESLSLRQQLRAAGGDGVLHEVGGTFPPARRTGLTACTTEEVASNDAAAVTRAPCDKEPEEAIDGLVCVGGGRGGALEAEVAGLVVWRRPLATEMLRDISACRRHHPPEDSDLVMSRDWSAEGNASLGSYDTRRLCSSDPRTILVQPAGTYTRHVTVCHALGGALLTYTDLTSTIMKWVRDTGNSCMGTDGPVTWLSGGQRAANGTAAAKVKTEEECPAVGVDGRVWAPCEVWLECSVCQVPSTVLYNLYGHDGRLFDHTYHSHNTSGRVMFRGVAGSEILRQEAGWLLRSSLHETQWLLPEAPVPVGRHWWSAAGEEVVLTLTHCRTTQFACDDGQCVRQTDRCDDIVHCRDRSDEANCQVVERPPGYDPYYTPPPRPGEIVPTELSYHIDVYNVGDVTTNAGEASMDVGITIAWFDPRLKFLNLKPRVKNYFPCRLVWTPRVRAISGSGEGNLLDTNDYEKFCYTYDNDETEQRPLHDPLMGHQAEGVSHAIETYLGVLAWVPCRFQLQMYPFDAQLCNLSFVVVNAPSTHVFRKSSPGNHVPYLNARRVLLEYVLEDQTTEVGWFLQGTDNNTYFVLTYHLRRLYGYHVMNSYFPSLLMFFISYATFFFQLEDFTNRIMISLTAQLVLAALFTSTTQSSVKTPYLKLIDVWYAAIITFCFLIIIAQTVINAVLHSSGRLPSAVTIGVQILRPLHRTQVEPLFTRRGDARLHTPTRPPPPPPPPPGHRMARLCNAMARVLLFASVVVFVVIYSLTAGGLLHFPGTADIGGAA